MTPIDAELGDTDDQHHRQEPVAKRAIPQRTHNQQMPGQVNTTHRENEGAERVSQ
jgi:hypothetical protein